MKLVLLLLSTTLVFAQDARTWDAKRAAEYLDERVGWWMSWQSAARDHDTFCVSCHTALPYALARPALRSVAGSSPNEQKLLENVKKRVKLWAEVEPFYSDEKQGAPKTAEARGTESVLNAIILTSYDAPTGKLSDVTKAALDNMWAAQWKIGETRGAWSWLNFHNQPWEADDSQFWGATLAAIAAGKAPKEYRTAPEVEQNIALLVGYLRRMQSEQSLLNRVSLLWASAKLPNLLEPKEQEGIAKEIRNTQQPDGGWSAGSLVMKNWKRRDDTPFETKADGYATGLVLYALQQAGISDASVKRGLEWLAKNQEKETGFWPANSLNGKKDLSAEKGKFLSDAATAYSVMALTTASGN
jgi:squalene-hopene/tetraprenyl-beta-curcumene cyclase